jgi:hypothetical protein
MPAVDDRDCGRDRDHDPDGRKRGWRGTKATTLVAPLDCCGTKPWAASGADQILDPLFESRSALRVIQARDRLASQSQFSAERDLWL